MVHALEIAYVGTRFAGWQRQSNALAVQEVVETALAGLAGAPVALVAAGRTDAGVHAQGQVASFRLPRPLPLAALVHGTNARLPPEIRVLRAAAVDDAFHARRSAAAKHYRYRLFLGRSAPPALAPFVWTVPEAIDLGALEAATACLPGRHDFAAVALAGAAPGPTVRHLFSAAWQRRERELALTVAGEGFLRGRGRGWVGTLDEIGRGRRAPAAMRALLAGAPRSAAGETAPARGLALARVDYPEALAPVW